MPALLAEVRSQAAVLLTQARSHSDSLLHSIVTQGRYDLRQGRQHTHQQFEKVTHEAKRQINIAHSTNQAALAVVIQYGQQACRQNHQAIKQNLGHIDHLAKRSINDART